MARIFKSEEKKEERMLPAVSRVQAVHSPIAVLSRAVTNIHLRNEATYPSVRVADQASMISRNVDGLGLEGSPLSSRFARLVESI